MYICETATIRSLFSPAKNKFSSYVYSVLTPKYYKKDNMHSVMGAFWDSVSIHTLIIVWYVDFQ